MIRRSIFLVIFLVLINCVELFSRDFDPWLNGFPYRKPITVSNTGSAQTDYQLLITVTYVSGKMNSDFSDIRFTQSDGVTLITHWRESYTASTSATFWVKVPSIPIAGTTVYMYYGNSDATSLSNGANTFLFFTDWESGNIEGWNLLNGGGTGSGSVVSLNGSYQLELYAPDLSNRVQANKAFAVSNSGMMMEGRLKIGSPAPIPPPNFDGVYFGFGDGTIFNKNEETPNNGYVFHFARFYNVTSAIAKSVAGVLTQLVSTPGSVTANTYYLIGLSWLGTQLKAWQNRGNILTVNDATYASRNYVFVSSSVGDKYYDWVFVRKFTSPEPTASTGAEDALVTKVGLGWSWKVPINIAGSTIALTNYQVKIPITFVSGKMNADFSDIRFTTSDGTTIISYWRESYVASTSAVFWVKMPSIPVVGTTIYMYYGNTSATSLTNGANTFLFFSDWESNTIEGWNILNAGGSGSGSVVLLDGSYQLRLNAPDYNNRVLVNKSFASSNTGMMIEARFKTGAFVPYPNFDGVYIGFGDGTMISNNTDFPNNGYLFGLARAYNVTTFLTRTVAGAVTQLVSTPASLSANTYYLSGLSWLGTQLKGWQNRSNVLTVNDATYTSQTYVFVSTSVNNNYYDWVFVRKYTSTEPTVSSYGSETYIFPPAEEWSWKVPSIGGLEKVRSGSATDWDWIIFQSGGPALTVPRGSATDWYWGP